MIASSFEVTAFSAPIENAPIRPVSFDAPRIVVCVGEIDDPPSGTSATPRGARPIRRE